MNFLAAEQGFCTKVLPPPLETLHIHTEKQGWCRNCINVSLRRTEKKKRKEEGEGEGGRVWSEMKVRRK